MTQYRVDCIRKRGQHYNPHERIEGLGGLAPWKWYDSEITIIYNIEAGVNSYYVSVGGKAVDVIVASHNGRKYLKTRSDGYAPNNLLNLPECA